MYLLLSLVFLEKLINWRKENIHFLIHMEYFIFSSSHSGLRKNKFFLFVSMDFPHFPEGEQEIAAVSKIPRSFLG